jgi:phage/plasmid-associated DNA primase
MSRTKEFESKEPKDAEIQALQKKFGPPAYENSRHRLSKLNEAFWAGLRARESRTIYCPEENQFYRYNSTNGLHELITEHKLRAEFEQRIYEAALSWGKTWSKLEEFRNTSSLNGIIGHFKGQVEVRGAFKNTENIFACKNCLIRFKERPYQIETLAFDPKYRLRYGSPLVYDPVAKCPRFLASILGHVEKDDRETLQKLAGQALIGRNLIQRFGILDGVGAASKTEFIMTVRGVVGSEGCAELRTECLENRFEIGAIARASLLYGPDVPGNFLSLRGAYRLKSLVGGDALECEFKNFKLPLPD